MPKKLGQNTKSVEAKGIVLLFTIFCVNVYYILC
jgi:hypothetical protein